MTSYDGGAGPLHIESQAKMGPSLVISQLQLPNPLHMRISDTAWAVLVKAKILNWYTTQQLWHEIKACCSLPSVLLT